MKQQMIKDIYPLTPLQEGIGFYFLDDPNQSIYYERFILSCEGEIDIDILQQAVQKLVDRHDILRTVFQFKRTKRPLQVVLKKRSIEVVFHNLTDDPFKQQNLQSLIDEDMKRGFDLEQEMLLRVQVFQMSRKTFKLFLSFHHIILDGWSFAILMKEMLSTYIALKQNKALELSEPMQFSHYIQWMMQQNKKDLQYFWQNYLSEISHIGMIPHDHTATNYVHDAIELRLSAERTNQLQAFAQKQKVAPNTVFQAIWSLVLHQYTQSEDIIFGTVVSGRNADVQKIETIVGMLINTIPSRVKLDVSDSFVGLVKQLHQTENSKKGFDHASLLEVQEIAGVNEPLFDHILAFENFPIEETMKLSNDNHNLGFSILNMDAFEQTNYNLNIIVAPAPELRVTFRYNKAVYQQSKIQKLAELLEYIATLVLANANCSIRDYDLVLPVEKEKIVDEWNHTVTVYPHNEWVDELFQDQVKRNVNKPAVVSGSTYLSYQQLEEKSNLVCQALLSHAIKPGSSIGVVCE
ncbi:condensation domain-containing protein, partial [Lysinibacillus fusiformis]|uniref:condensation domain-containing protein n=1 Tax=Lysinibacillus fusiformis TaxID=28031 RepID=UPI00383043BF